MGLREIPVCPPTCEYRVLGKYQLVEERRQSLIPHTQLFILSSFPLGHDWSQHEWGCDVLIQEVRNGENML